ncbi:MAG: glycosyltransferase family 4 protein [Verrucomicrobia bacterium]|nr:glycosyltransferase family 4 protein [Verrucomicrobiota bacterium]
MALIAVAWYGLPFYAANVIAYSRRRYPEHDFVIVSTQVGVPYVGIEELIGVPVKWVDSTEPISWAALGTPVPDVCIITSWNHKAYLSLALEARTKRGAKIIAMVDNYFHGTAKQWAGAIYFRLRLRRIFSAMWVPGVRSRRFMGFLGMPDACIFEGLYTADPLVFYPPSISIERHRVIFVGQFIPRKGVGEIVKFLNTASGILWRTRLRMIGHGPLEAELRSAGMPIEPFMQPIELGGAYREASALLLPSRMDHWGVVAHEAALCGCLILATRQCGSVDDLVEHGQNGFIMNESSSLEIERALAWLEGLSIEQINAARIISIAKASSFSPRNWSNTLAEIASL